MEMLRAKGKQVVDSKGNVIRLRGTCIGGWMNLENFINGYPGAETQLRETVINELGTGKGKFFFECLLDYFFNEDDIRFIKESGANLIRIPLNYRHFEDDANPFVYKESGFNRLNRVIDWCEQYEIYVILDLHAVQGWQNSHWHCDNNRGVSLFWHNPHYQERFIALWKELAVRYKERAVIAGYNLMNEPCTNTSNGDYPFNYFLNYRPDFAVMNRVYRKTVEAIRKIDNNHLVFLEGDKYSVLFSGLDAPFADNLIYSSHNYQPAGFGPGPYPGEFHSYSTDLEYQSGYWDRKRQSEFFKECEGFQFTERHQVPLWVGEFGAQYYGSKEEIPDRLMAMDDQIGVFEEFGVHWTTWTYKDIGVMGWVTLDPESEYMRMITGVQQKKHVLGAENFVKYFQDDIVKNKISDLADLLEKETTSYAINHTDNVIILSDLVLRNYAATLLQPVYARLFQGMSEERVNDILSSFAFKKCKINQGLMNLLQKHLG